MQENKSRLILLNASPVGDHVLLLDVAERFYISGGVKTVMFIKHNFKFLFELSLGYESFIKCVDFSTFFGKLYFLYMFLNSFFTKNYLLYFLPIPHKKYLIYLGDAFHYLTKCVVISQEYKDMSEFIPKGVHVEANINDKYYFEQTNNILTQIGFKEIPSSPYFKFVKDYNVKAEFKLDKKYIVIHPTPSHVERRVSLEKWQEAFDYAEQNDCSIVFTGIKKDEEYIDSLASALSKKNFVKVIDAPAQSLVNLFYFAEKLFMVHTGPTHIAAALHKKMKVFCHLWLKQFDFGFNENAEVEILSRVDLVNGKLEEIK